MDRLASCGNRTSKKHSQKHVLCNSFGCFIIYLFLAYLGEWTATTPGGVLRNTFVWAGLGSVPGDRKLDIIGQVVLQPSGAPGALDSFEI